MSLNFPDRVQRSIADRLQRMRLQEPHFSIIANNCWGAEAYRQLKLPYATPFVGSMVYAPCYLKLASDLKGYLSTPLEFTEVSRYDNVNDRRANGSMVYPIGTLGDVEIHFFHYPTLAEAKDKWNRRMERFNWDRVFLRFSTLYKARDEHIKAFDAIDVAPKVCFSDRPYPGLESVVYMPDYDTDGSRIYRKSLKYFDVVDWLNGGTGKLSPFYQTLHRLLYE